MEMRCHKDVLRSSPRVGKDKHIGGSGRESVSHQANIVERLRNTFPSGTARLQNTFPPGTARLKNTAPLMSKAAYLLFYIGSKRLHIIPGRDSIEVRESQLPQSLIGHQGSRITEVQAATFGHHGNAQAGLGPYLFENFLGQAAGFRAE